MTRKHWTRETVLYVLHYDHPNGDIWHYAGVTEPHRLRIRIKEHRTSKQTPRTRRARAEGFRQTGYTVIPRATPWLERSLQSEEAARFACKTCQERHGPTQATAGAARPPDSPSFLMLRDMNSVPRLDRWRR